MGALSGAPISSSVSGVVSPAERWPAISPIEEEGPRTGPCPGLAQRAAQRPQALDAARPAGHGGALCAPLPAPVVLAHVRGAGRAREARGHRPVPRLHCPRLRRAQCRLARRPPSCSRPAWPGRGRREGPFPCAGLRRLTTPSGPPQLVRRPGRLRPRRAEWAPPRRCAARDTADTRQAKRAWLASDRGAAWPEGRPRPQGRDAPGLHGA